MSVSTQQCLSYHHSTPYYIASPSARDRPSINCQRTQVTSRYKQPIMSRARSMSIRHLARSEERVKIGCGGTGNCR